MNRLQMAACLLAAPSLWAQSDYALRGTLITPTGLVENGIVLVRQGRIAAVGGEVQVPAGEKVIDTGGVILPGLVDLHNHVTYNVFPRWHPNQEFGNRYDWQQKQIYQTMIEAPHAGMVADGMACRMERYAEVKAITEGETALVGSLPEPCSAGLAHNLDTEAAWQVRYDVFPLQTPEAEMEPIRRQLASHQLHAFLIHLGEGSHQDAAAAREFSMLKARGLLMPGVALIHGGGLQTPDFAEMAEHGVSLIWSPRSNLELYGNTADVAAAKAAHVKIALSPDWSPTGSDGLLAELSFAAAWNEKQSPRPFTDRELVAMATSIPSEIVGADGLGSLEPGKDADLLVIHPEGQQDAWWVVTHATAAQVSLVTIDGAALYGDPLLLSRLSQHSTQKLDICGGTKALVLGGAHGNVDAGDETWAESTATLEAALRHHGRHLAPLAECGQ